MSNAPKMTILTSDTGNQSQTSEPATVSQASTGSGGATQPDVLSGDGLQQAVLNSMMNVLTDDAVNQSQTPEPTTANSATASSSVAGAGDFLPVLNEAAETVHNLPNFQTGSGVSISQTLLKGGKVILASTVSASKTDGSVETDGTRLNETNIPSGSGKVISRMRLSDISRTNSSTDGTTVASRGDNAPDKLNNLNGSGTTGQPPSTEIQGFQTAGTDSSVSAVSSAAVGVQPDKTGKAGRASDMNSGNNSVASVEAQGETGTAAVSSAESTNTGNDKQEGFRSMIDSAGAPVDKKEKSQSLSMESVSGDSALHAQTEKTAAASSSSNEIRPTDSSSPAEVLKQVVEKISPALQAGQSEIKIDLTPASLGRLQLQVSTDHQQVTVKILAENAQVKDMIQNQAPQIKIELQQQGIKVDSVDVGMLMTSSGGSDFASSQNQNAAFWQTQNESAYSGRQKSSGTADVPVSNPGPAFGSGGLRVNYFA